MSRGRRPVLVIAQIVTAAGLLAWLVHLFGTRAVTGAGSAATPVTLVAAVALGIVGGLAQGLRWQAVSHGLGDRMSAGHAVARCLESAFLNAVLPGGLAGDAVRAVQRRRSGSQWATSIGSVVGERLCGTAVVLIASAVAAFSIGRADLAMALGVGAMVVGGIAGWSMRRLPARAVLACVVWSVVGWLAFLGVFVLAAGALAEAGVTPRLDVPATTTLGALTLAGMSVPLNLGGWGPREGAASLAYDLAGLDPSAGFTTSVAYGLLALVSTLPGAVVLLASALDRRNRRRPAPR